MHSLLNTNMSSIEDHQGVVHLYQADWIWNAGWMDRYDKVKSLLEEVAEDIQERVRQAQ